ncbi:ATP-binding protein [Aliiruegeria lutimaris]|uniref:Serine/threonine-protein kinase RsbW n=1 Tax=Aliiruegeria lutimaris TaxID=571298 RepID=A0A1G8MCB7_9RHOB|nr:ATP-binding protein [Aliiruegeria lutimaris]SDI65581.1 serine/threonine-protein kinase RsbW [Aliiruegeria lutimaris]
MLGHAANGAVTSGTDHMLSETVDSTAEDVRNALIRINDELKRLGVAPSDRDAIEVVLAECMNNVVEHAYCERPGSRFDLKLHLSADNLFCRVEDDGKPMPGLALPSGKSHNLSVDLSDLPEGGFGWFLIRELTCDLRYARERDRNNLMFQIPLSHDEG